MIWKKNFIRGRHNGAMGASKHAAGYSLKLKNSLIHVRFLRTSKPKTMTGRRFSKWNITGLLSASGLLVYVANDDVSSTVNHSYYAVKRVSVVTIAAIECFSLYRKTLTAVYDSPEDRLQALSKTHLKSARITRRALEENRGIFIKLGQHISALTYLLPQEWTDTMIPLQDQCPRSSIEEIENMFRKDLGQSMEDVFSEFDPEPVGVASLAQVHIATLRSTGEKVAVKIQHPSLAEFVPIDVYMTQKVFQMMYKFFPEYPLTWLGDELQSSIYVELNFVNEANNAERTAEHFKSFQKQTCLRIPKVVSASSRILVMECVTGARLDNKEYLKQHNIKPEQVSSCLSHIFNRMIFSRGVGLHCDPHGGNLAIRSVDPRRSSSGKNFEIILYDHGLYRQIPDNMKYDYARFWIAILEKDVPNMKLYAKKVAGIEGEQNFKIFTAAITGRAPETALNYDITKKVSPEELERLRTQLHNEKGVLENLMHILSNMPRIILLILKTNDLTRHLDETLDSPLGPERTFLILAKYCAKTVFDYDREWISSTYSRYSLSWIYNEIKAWWSYESRIISYLFIKAYFTYRRPQM